jgi:glycosyltransferase involved in cell wall biosynthesis
MQYPEKSNQMNIAYISADFGVPIFGYKGASIHVREMVAALQRAGHSVSLISPALETSEGEKEGNGDKAKDESTLSLLSIPPQEHHLQLNKELERLDEFLGLKSRLRQELRNLLYNRTLYEKALEYLRWRRVDFIYERYALFSYAGIRLARELGVPHILEVNAPLAYEQEKMRGLEMKDLARETERRIFCDTDQLIVVSRSLQEFAVSCGVAESRIKILPNAVDPQRFAMPPANNGATVRERLQLGGKRVIGFVGSLKPWHGTETLFQAFRDLHTAAANKREELEKYAQANGLDGAVTFTGNVPYDDVPQCVAAMDIAVAPYIPHENFYYSPIKIFEYMVMGKPVVAGRIGQVEEVITDGETGVLYEPGNIGQLTAALARLVGDAQLSERIGERAKRWVQQERTWANNAQQVLAIAGELIEKRNDLKRNA